MRVVSEWSGENVIQGRLNIGSDIDPRLDLPLIPVVSELTRLTQLYTFRQ